MLQLCSVLQCIGLISQFSCVVFAGDTNCLDITLFSNKKAMASEAYVEHIYFNLPFH
jgi:hypothetical protein